MPYPLATILVVLAVAVAVPGIVVGLATLAAGPPPWLARRGAQPGIQAYLMLVVLAIVAVAASLLVPFAVAFGGLSHRFTAVVGLFLAVLIAAGIAYAWRRGVLRWD